MLQSFGALSWVIGGMALTDRGQLTMLGKQFAVVLQRSRDVLPSAEFGGQSLELVEYAALKQEQSTRIALRETALYVNLAASISLLAARLQSVISVDDRVMLLMPFLSGIMFWIYFNNDSYVRDIGQYIVKYLAPRIAQHLPRPSASATDTRQKEDAPQGEGEARGQTEFVFAWEHLHRHGTLERRVRKIAALSVLTLSFVAVPVLALWTPIEHQALHGVVLWEWIGGVAMTMVMTVGVVRLYV